MQSPKILNIPQIHTYNNPIMMLKIDHNLRKSNYVINRNRLHNYGTRNGAIPRLQLEQILAKTARLDHVWSGT